MKERAGGKLGHVLAIVVAAALGGFLFGFDTAVINGAVPVLQKMFMAAGEPGRIPFNLGLPATRAAADFWIGLSVAMALAGAAFGAFFAGPIADAIGRKKSMVIAAALLFVSALGSGVPFTIWDFTLWRIIGGLGFGAASVLAPAYIAEVSPADKRGRLGSLQQLAIVTGIFIALTSNYALARAAGGAGQPWWFGPAAWQWMFWMEAIPALVWGVLALRIPESPRYLVAQNRDGEALVVLGKILGAEQAPGKVEEIHQSLRRGHKPRMSDLLAKSGGLLPIVWLGIGLSVFQQLVGINVVFYYSNLLWQLVGFGEERALLLTVIGGATNVATTFIAIALVDRVGRKALLIAGSAGMFVSLSVMAYVLGSAPMSAEGLPRLGESAGLVALVSLNVFVFSFGFSWGPVVWVMLGEMFSNQIRGAALAVAAAAQWITNFLVSLTFPTMASVFGLGASYGFYAFAALLSLFFVVAWIPETKGKELEQMGEFETGRPPPD
ncbi:MAG: sugar porter family MFS transporter [Polyangiaceae bacterium]|nr:sugar porter family MFS transporter [Polyangiaceae bacterium]